MKNLVVGERYLVKERKGSGNKAKFVESRNMELLEIYPKFLVFNKSVAGGSYRHTISVCDLISKKANLRLELK